MENNATTSNIPQGNTNKCEHTICEPTICNSFVSTTTVAYIAKLASMILPQIYKGKGVNSAINHHSKPVGAMLVTIAIGSKTLYDKTTDNFYETALLCECPIVFRTLMTEIMSHISTPIITSIDKVVFTIPLISIGIALGMSAVYKYTDPFFSDDEASNTNGQDTPLAGATPEVAQNNEELSFEELYIY